MSVNKHAITAGHRNKQVGHVAAAHREVLRDEHALCARWKPSQQSLQAQAVPYPHSFAFARVVITLPPSTTMWVPVT